MAVQASGSPCRRLRARRVPVRTGPKSTTMSAGPAAIHSGLSLLAQGLISQIAADRIDRVGDPAPIGPGAALLGILALGADRNPERLGRQAEAIRAFQIIDRARMQMEDQPSARAGREAEGGNPLLVVPLEAVVRVKPLK